MSGQVSRGSAGEYQADERAGVARLVFILKIEEVQSFWKKWWFLIQLNIELLHDTAVSFLGIYQGRLNYMPTQRHVNEYL